ncbi:MAG: FAD:protein FMN transferase [Thiobacillus sp.]
MQRAQPGLGTLVEIAASGVSTGAAHSAVSHAFTRIGEIQTRMSWHDPDSELSQINRVAHRDWIGISSDLATVLRMALDLAKQSDGLFDPTVAPLLCETGHLPRHADMPADIAISIWQAIELEVDRVRFVQPLAVDLGGIAKGYAVDAALGVLANAGLESACVNAGGDLARFGPRPESIRIRHPSQPSRTLHLLDLQHGAVATSAGYFQTRHHDGRRVSPLRHPKTRASLCLDDSITVVAPTCMLADALTKVVAADPANAPARLRAFGAQALRLDTQGASLQLAITDSARDDWTRCELDEAAA